MRQPRSGVARNRRLLVEAAIESFHELGWDVPLDTVARRAGVGNATLYRHFPTRDDLYEAAFAELHERLAAVLNRYQDVEDGWQAARARLGHLLDGPGRPGDGGSGPGPAAVNTIRPVMAH